VATRSRICGECRDISPIPVLTPTAENQDDRGSSGMRSHGRFDIFVGVDQSGFRGGGRGGVAERFTTAIPLPDTDQLPDVSCFGDIGVQECQCGLAVDTNRGGGDVAHAIW